MSTSRQKLSRISQIAEFAWIHRRRLKVEKYRESADGNRSSRSLASEGIKVPGENGSDDMKSTSEVDDWCSYCQIIKMRVTSSAPSEQAHYYEKEKNNRVVSACHGKTIRGSLGRWPLLSCHLRHLLLPARHPISPGPHLSPPSLCNLSSPPSTVSPRPR